ncbi:MAG: hypothetical protein EZS28_031929, partial [Streblomastix strix]
SRGDHQHPLQVSDVLPSKDTSVGTIGTASTYARSDHQPPIQTVDTIQVSDSADGSYGTVDSYARNDHSYSINILTNASIEPMVNGVGNNGTSAYYSRHDHIHPQQLTYEGNLTATKFIKTGGTVNDILLANGDAKKSVQASKLYQVIEQPYLSTRTGFGQLQFSQHWTNNISAFQGNITDIPTIDAQSALPTGQSGLYQLFLNTQNGPVQINPNDIGTFNEGNNTTNPLGFIIVLAGQEGQADRGLQISVDGSTITFNGQVIAETGTANCSVNYSAGIPIVWGVNNLGTEGGFYSNGTNICWRARPVTLGSVPP